MPYPPRIYVPEASVHVIRRGNNRGAIFTAADDYEALLRFLRDGAAENGVSVHGFVLMTTHYHLLATPHRATALQDMMKTVGEGYVRYYNSRHDRIGTLWAGRYRAIVIADDRYWLTCLRYIEQNPYRANMVSTPEHYRWSSYRVHALGEHSDWLVAHPLYLGLGATPEERQKAYRAVCGVALTEDELAEQRHPKRRRPSKVSDVSEVSDVSDTSDIRTPSLFSTTAADTRSRLRRW